MNHDLRLLRRVWWLLLLPALLSCSEVRLIGAYDAKVDDAIQSIARQVSTLAVKIDQQVDNGKSFAYSNYEEAYVSIKTDVRTLKIRANGLPKYAIIQQQIALLESSVAALEADHRSGFVAPGVTNPAIIKAAIAPDFSGIETALSAMLTLQDGLKRSK